ncbi:MAG TPA: energy transducer TonB [Gallionella sp.]|nr:energy transducer TonB [Gallionella sp.]
MLARLQARFSLAMIFSVALHAFALFGIALTLPDAKQLTNLAQPLQVVLVNAKTKSKPVKARARAQANLDGGGNTAEDRQLKSALPALSNAQRFTPEQTAKHVTELEAESKRLLTQLKSDRQIAAPEIKKQQPDAAMSGEDLVQKSLEIIRLEAQINKNMDYYQKLPRRKNIGAQTQEYRFAQYIEDWRVKVERIGNLNYPEQARQQQLFGKLTLSVSIRADGSIEDVIVDRPSGQRILDAAAVRIVKLAAPYAPLPPDISKDVDILTITRTWTFTTSDRLESE